MNTFEDTFMNGFNKNCCYVVRFKNASLPEKFRLAPGKAEYYCGVERVYDSRTQRTYPKINVGEFSAKLLTKAGATKTSKRVAEELFMIPIICKVDFDKLAESNFVVCDGNVVDLYQKKQTIDNELAFMGMFEVVDNGNQYYTS